MSWSGVVEPPQAPVSAARRKEPPVERFGCAQKQELNEIFGTIFDRQLNSSRQRDLHIRVVFETNQMEDSSSSVCATMSRTTFSSSMSVIERSIGSTADASRSTLFSSHAVIAPSQQPLFSLVMGISLSAFLLEIGIIATPSEANEGPR
ncbi:hypothetical protein PRIPAC_72182 [Pristionchus pacificus]|uniref:Uncharacterized protein n=1 Tax=Pristionchus pacificus TaxID=54126 RepID=A0A2A6B521_PRIPA|nr:hypothetical protein PRIPAC_72182 [Pristionchus pacificus]|eukprot:PDM60979.1 hypothetical protein PRIPAC_54785 [Pristionchus pacificus]